jgi:hypothetical protein
MHSRYTRYRSHNRPPGAKSHRRDMSRLIGLALLGLALLFIAIGIATA